MKWFNGVNTIEELRKCYRELLKKHHPDNGGRLEDMQEINREYDLIFAELRRSTCKKDDSSAEEEKAENEAFKGIMEQIAHINADVEVIGSWLWVHGGYEYRELLKSIGFRFAPKKKCWCCFTRLMRKRRKTDSSCCKSWRSKKRS